MRQGFDLLKGSVQDRTQYFRQARMEIAERNLQMLEFTSIASSVFVLYFIFLTPYIVKGWHVTWAHILFVPVNAMFFLFAFFYKKQKEKTAEVINGACLAFIAMYCIFCGIMDVFPYVNEPGTFIPIVIMIAPLMFEFPYHVLYTVLVVVEIIYVLMLVQFKSISMMQHDVFASLVALFGSVVATWIVLNLRKEAYHERNRYRELSTKDILTGIFNKAYSENEVTEYLDQRDKENTYALLIMDIDNFKAVNDQKGHKMGDFVLSNFGRILKEAFNEKDIIGRIGGDEFMVFAKDVSDEEQLQKKYDYICGEVKKIAKDIKFPISCSMGIVMLKEENIEFEKLFHQADDALYEAKAGGKAQFVLRHARESENNILKIWERSPGALETAQN